MKSSRYSDKGCVWNEDAPTVAFARPFSANRSLWFIFNRRLFLRPTVLRSDGKDNAMKNEDSKNRKSKYNANRTCYLTSDGKYYCYEVWDAEKKCIVTQKLEVGKDLSLELTLFLDALDHEQDLSDRYEDEHRDLLFDSRSIGHKEDLRGEEIRDPWNNFADMNSNPEDILFPEAEPENPQVAAVRRVIDEQCTEAQQDLFFRHFGEGAQLEELRQEEAERTGTMPSSQAFSNRKNKIVNKAAKVLGVERVKRRKPSKKD